MRPDESDLQSASVYWIGVAMIKGSGRGRFTSSWVVGFLPLLMALGCRSPIAPPDETIAPSKPSGALQMSGKVLDENGIPVADAIVEVDYFAGAGSVSVPVSHCPLGQFCWIETRTNASGEYTITFQPRPWPSYEIRASGSLGYVYTFREGYDLDVQWVPNSSSPAVRDLRLHPLHKIAAGESIEVNVEPTSSLCTDLEDGYFMKNRCELVVIESGAGTLDIDAHTADGSPALLFWYTSGNYDGFNTKPAPGLVSMRVRSGTYNMMVGIPEGQPAQRFTIKTSLR